jgi:membrane fusion protein, multidrug efflux system
MKSRAVYLIPLLIVAAAIYFLYPRGVKVDVVRPHRGVAVQAVYATGTVEPTVMLPIAARGMARLVELKVDEGSDVKKGQLLARLEDDELQASRSELLAREEYAKKEYERLSILLKANAASRGDFEKAHSEWKAASAAVRAQEAQIGYMSLTAPEDGRIIRRDGEMGEMIPANQAIFWMSCCAPLRISTEVDEEDIPLVKPEQKVAISADAFPEKVFEGKVQQITPKGDSIARSYRVRVSLTGEHSLLIGMTAETNIIIRETPNALLVPSTAVSDGAVWIADGGKAFRKKVSVGAVGERDTEILGGLDGSERVIVRPPGLTEGDKLSITEISSTG